MPNQSDSAPPVICEPRWTRTTEESLHPATEADPRPSIGTSTWIQWPTNELRPPENGEPLREQLARTTPANALLLRWASSVTNQPASSWWDESDDPFAVED